MALPAESRGAVPRTPYFYQDPVRAAGLASAVLLMLLRDVPFVVALFAVGVSQVNCIAMVMDAIGAGWSSKWGRRARSAVMTNNLAIDWANTGICTLVGAMVLMRFFGPPVLVLALGCMALAVGLLPDIRFCRVILPRDAHEASRVLDRGYFFRDPIKLGALCALLMVCVLDRTSLAFVFLSMVLIQFNALLIFVDKYATELRTKREHGWIPLRTVRLMLARDGQRLVLTLVPVALVPLRLGLEEPAGRWAAAAVAAVIVVPDLVRMAVRLVAGVFGLSVADVPAKA